MIIKASLCVRLKNIGNPIRDSIIKFARGEDLPYAQWVPYGSVRRAILF